MDMNMDVQDIAARLKGSPAAKLAAFSYGRAAGLGLAAALGLAGWHEWGYLPKEREMAADMERLAELSEKAEALPAVRANIGKMRESMKKESASYEQAMERFYEGSPVRRQDGGAAAPSVNGGETAKASAAKDSEAKEAPPAAAAVEPVSAEVEEAAYGDLFRNLTQVAEASEMIVLKIQKASLSPEAAGRLLPETARRTLSPQLLPASLRVKGSYKQFLKFCKNLRSDERVHAVVSEGVELSKDERYFGYLEAEFVLAAYALRKEPLHQTLASIAVASASSAPASVAKRSTPNAAR